jgi:hypothetical protein
MAAAEGLGSAIAFSKANAEALPFPDSSYDGVFSVTALEAQAVRRGIPGQLRRRSVQSFLRPRQGGQVASTVRFQRSTHIWDHQQLLRRILARILDHFGGLHSLLDPPLKNSRIGRNVEAADRRIYRGPRPSLATKKKIGGSLGLTFVSSPGKLLPSSSL